MSVEDAKTALEACEKGVDVMIASSKANAELVNDYNNKLAQYSSALEANRLNPSLARPEKPNKPEQNKTHISISCCADIKEIVASQINNSLIQQNNDCLSDLRKEYEDKLKGNSIDQNQNNSIKTNQDTSNKNNNSNMIKIGIAIYIIISCCICACLILGGVILIIK